VIDKANFFNLLSRFWSWITGDPSAFFTFVLAVTATIQSFFLIRANKTARLAANAAKRAFRAQIWN
jgi:hypothetical protein